MLGEQKLCSWRKHEEELFQLVKPAKQAWKIEDQSVGSAQERHYECIASMQLWSGIILFFEITAFAV